MDRVLLGSYLTLELIFQVCALGKVVAAFLELILFINLLLLM